jgi:hypothetical protein
MDDGSGFEANIRPHAGAIRHPALSRITDSTRSDKAEYLPSPEMAGQRGSVEPLVCWVERRHGDVDDAEFAGGGMER